MEFVCLRASGFGFAYGFAALARTCGVWVDTRQKFCEIAGLVLISCIEVGFVLLVFSLFWF